MQVVQKLAVLLAMGIGGCGTVPPQINEAWEGRDIDNNMSISIKKKIFCELVDALLYVNRNRIYEYGPAIPKDYSVQMAITLTMEESSGFNPGVNLTTTFPNGTESGVTIGQNFNFGLGANLSATATRVDTAYTYFIVGRIADEHNEKECHKPETVSSIHGSSLLIQSDLGLKEFLVNAVDGADIIHSSPKPKESAKPDVYSYETKFLVVTNGNINPTWKLVRTSSNNGTPFLSFGRSRTHDLILTFGPTDKGGLGPSLSSVNQQLIQQQGVAFSRALQSAR